ncbi:TPA: TniB family NTP-binding protein, partial [Vibrio antiquarius]
MKEKSDTIQRVKQIFIGNPQISEILSDIAECREFSDGVAEPDCMIVVGDTGSGKTTIIDKYLSENPRKEHNEGSVVPILFTTLPPNATPITASEQLLSDLGDPFAFQKGKDHVELTKKMVELMRECRVDLIIIDEFQHMIDRKNKEVLHSAADWLKLLIVRSKIPVVLFGMPYSTVILDANSQLAGRFELQHKLEPFRVDN